MMNFNTSYVQYMYSYPHKTAYRALFGVHLQDYARYLKGRGHSLYLHIPFCETKCGYCNLFSVTGQGEGEISRYLEQVKRQLCQYQEILAHYGTGFSDFAVGGGTPLLLSEKQLDTMFSMISGQVSFDQKAAFLIETAPNQTTEGKLRRLKEAGVTRVSMGIQSFSKEELALLGRRHSPETARTALKRLMAFDFPVVNVDFIYGIPGQTVASLMASLQEALTYEPGEIFLYPLYVKHGARMEKMLEKGMALDGRQTLCQYREASAYLRAEGYRQDSMRRFVRVGKSASGEALPERDLQDCGFHTSLSLGCGGRSYLGELHFCTPYAITPQSCLDQLRIFEATGDFSVIRHGILLSEEELCRRYVIRHLLIRPGIPLGAYGERFRSKPQEDFPIIQEWISRGYVVHSIGKGEGGEDYLYLSDEGMALSDYLGPQLISPWIRERMEEWERLHEKDTRKQQNKNR